MIHQVKSFSFVFLENLGHYKLVSKLADLYIFIYKLILKNKIVPKWTSEIPDFFLVRTIYISTTIFTSDWWLIVFQPLCGHNFALFLTTPLREQFLYPEREHFLIPSPRHLVQAVTECPLSINYLD